MSSNYILPQGFFKGGYFIILWPISKGFQLAWHFGRRHPSTPPQKKPVQRCPSLFGAEIRQRFVQSQWVFLHTNYIFNNACEWTIPNPPNFGSLNHFGPKKLQGGTTDPRLTIFYPKDVSNSQVTEGTGQENVRDAWAGWYDKFRSVKNRLSNVREECFPVFISRGNPGRWNDVYLLISLVYC